LLRQANHDTGGIFWGTAAAQVTALHHDAFGAPKDLS